jgi:hypothetical protein
MFGGIASGIGSVVGGLIGANSAQQSQQFNYGAQKEFAQNGIRWKVEDAKRAGIHPLYALGASTASYSPVQGYSGDYGISDAFSQMGQGVARAAQAKMTKEERDREDARQEMQDVFNLARFNMEQRRQEAEIKLIDSEIARNKAASEVALRSTAVPPAMPSGPTLIPGQGNAPATGTKDAPYWDRSIPQMGFSHDASGRLVDVIPSDDYASRTEDKFIVEWLPWVQAAWRNFKAKSFGTPVDGYWWHGDDKGYLPYPPKGARNDKMASDYYSNSYRYR